jgi:hypothetical protein
MKKIMQAMYPMKLFVSAYNGYHNGEPNGAM